MTTTTGLLALTDTGECELDAAVAARRRVAACEAGQLDHIAAYVQQATAADPLMAARPGGPRMIEYGGPGTPQVCEFTICEVAAALGQSPRTATTLVADALDLTFRLPRLFAALHNGTVEAWKVRKTASATRDFTAEQADQVDTQLSGRNTAGVPLLARVGMTRLRTILEQIRPATEPDGPDDETGRNLAQRYLDLRPLEPGVGDIHGTLSIEDTARLDARLNHIADTLRNAGDQRPRPVLRSVALGMLADPGRLDHLYDGLQDEDEQTAPAPDTQPTEDGDDESGATTGSAFRRPLPSTVLYLHCDRASGTWLLEGAGPITRTEAIDILGHSRVVIKPVIDLAANLTYTGYIAPPRLKEQTALQNAGYCTFPSCNRPARTGDFDHIVDYTDGGPTSSRNGHRLCRYHHRCKTFTNWHVQSPAPGIWLWESPDRRAYLVTNGTTTRLDGRERERHRQPSAA